MTNKCSEDKEPTQNGPNSQPLAASISDTHKRVHKMRGERERGKNRSFFSLRKKELNFTSRAKPYISARFSTGYKSDAKLLLERWKERKLITPHTDIIFPATSARRQCIVFSRHKATLFPSLWLTNILLFFFTSYFYMLQRCLEKIVEPLVTGAPLILFSRGEK